MKKKWNFSTKQWEFLALLDAFHDPVPIDGVEALSPLPPSQLIDLVQQGEQFGLLDKQKSNLIALNPELPLPVREKIQRINTPRHLSGVLERLQSPDAAPLVPSFMRANLLAYAGAEGEAAFLEYDLACRALGDGAPESALFYFNQVVDHLANRLGEPDLVSRYVQSVLELSHLRFRSGKGVGEVMGLLKEAEKAAKRMGDLRSQTLIKLQMGRHFIMEEKPDVALKLLASGLEEVKDLGDADILVRAEEYWGLYYYSHGKFRQAVENLELALQRAEQRPYRPTDFLLPQWLAFSAVYRGHFRYAVSLLKSNWRRAWHGSEWTLADNFRAALGLVLLYIRKRQEGHAHLQEAHQSAILNQNHIGQFYTLMGLAYYHFTGNRINESYDITAKAVRQASERNVLFRQYTWPWFLEMLYAFDSAGFAPLEGFQFDGEINRLIQGHNIHLRGTAFRIKAQISAAEGTAPEKTYADLEASEAALMESGSAIELAKTWCEMARIKFRLGEKDTSRRLARMAWERLSALGKDFFPDDLRPLLTTKSPVHGSPHTAEEVMGRFLDIMEELVPTTDLDGFLRRVLAATGRFFGAERGGIFLFPSHKKAAAPLPRATYNLIREEVFSEGFRSKLALIKQSYKKNRIVQCRQVPEDDRKGKKRIPSVLCIPFEIRGQARGILFHDNTYLEDYFDSPDSTLLDRIARQVGSCIERIWDYCTLMEEKALLASKQSVMVGNRDADEIVFSSPIMKQVLDLADRVAKSEASVLITGETGTGKELLARRLHKRNPHRADGPFVVVDVSSIPENLVESDLFGHEKGAFTGADRQKRGRLELADGGTLFIDEVGDIPLNLQVKLLRTLQEKTFYRVGGTRALSSDFRLVAATNRDMETMVLDGLFREDLFYRLNVIPLRLPSLRERGRDIILLARHFLDVYIRKYNRPGLNLTTEDQTKLGHYPWPGNVRELKNLVERAVLISADRSLELELPHRFSAQPENPFEDTPTMEEMQRRYIRFILEKTGGRIAGKDGAAAVLGMKRTSLYSRMKILGLR